MKILALDDEVMVLEDLKTEISRTVPGVELVTVTDPDEAIAYVEQNRPQVVLLDIRMPKTDGITVAKKMKKIHPKLNIIFTTGFDNYYAEAIDLHCSGYVLKPVRGSVLKAKLDNLLYPQEELNCGIYAQTFGNFDLFHNGTPIAITGKQKELLAFLIDRNGSSVNNREIAATVLESDVYDRKVQKYISVIFTRLKDTLRQNGVEHILVKGRDAFSVNPSAFRCDAYEYVKGNPAALNAYTGEYMNQYSWGEDQKYRFER